MEIWKPVPGYEGYEASSEGRIRRTFSRILKGRADDYFRITMYTPRLKRVAVHAMVASAFLGPRPPGLVHNHKDGNKINNRPDNLEYVTYSENIQHAYDVLKRPRNSGVTHGRAKLTEDDVRSIRRMREEGASIATIATHFKMSQAMICRITTRKNWTHI